MGHYYSQRPDSASKLKEVNFIYRESPYRICTDNEVFSKSGLDRGTKVLLDFVISDLQNAKRDGAALEVLDLACGWGAVSLVLGRYFPNFALYLSDVNERAVALAKMNLQFNNVACRELKQAADFEAWRTKAFDIICLNPPIRIGKAKVSAMLEACLSHLQASGVFYCVIGKKQGADSYAAFLQSYAKSHDAYCYELLGKDNGFSVFKIEHKLASAAPES